MIPFCTLLIEAYSYHQPEVYGILGLDNQGDNLCKLINKIKCVW